MSQKIWGAEQMVIRALENGPKSVADVAAYTTLNRETARLIVADLHKRGVLYRWKDRWTKIYALANAAQAAA